MVLPVILWWLIIQILGWLALPLAMRLFRWLPDQGYTGAKALGLLLTSYIVWLGASAGFLRNDLGGILFAILILAGLSAWIWRRNMASGQESLLDFLKSKRRLILSVEILFTLAFILWAVLRAYAPDKIMNAGGEKFMEIAFLNGILNSPTFPPLDPWLSGFAIAYYYFGYVMMALITQLSGVPAGVGFDLYDALLFALTATGTFGVVYNLVSAGQNKPHTAQPDSKAIGFGLLGAMFVTVLGNLEGLLESLRARGALPQTFFDWIGIPDLANVPVTGEWTPGLGGGWWWWRGSRIIQDFDLSGTPLGVSPITEFPFFSFLLGDNHPHVLGLPFVILAIALAFNLLLGQLSKKAEEQQSKPAWWNPIRYSLPGESVIFWLAALLLGGVAFINTWDFPIYLGLVVLAYAAGQSLAAGRVSRDILVRSAVLGGGLALCAVALYTFFYIGFDSQAGGVLPYVFSPTRLPQYLVIFGIFIFIQASFLLMIFVDRIRQGKSSWRVVLQSWVWTAVAGIGAYAFIILVLAAGNWLSQAIPELSNPTVQAALGGLPFNQAAGKVLTERLQNPWLFMMLSGFIGLTIACLRSYLKGDSETSEPPVAEQASLVFALLLVLVGVLLTWSVEFIYLRDSFSVRMNTVFKFYFQGWVMLALGSAYALWHIANKVRLQPAVRAAVLAGAVVLILAGMVYPVMAFPARAYGFQSEPNLDGASGIARNNPDDWAAIQWLRQRAQETKTVPVILEAPGKSYNYEGRISAFTGYPAVLGWAIHESQWRGSYEEQGKREPDIAAIYTTNDPVYALELLQKWDVDYVIVGWPEQTYIQETCNTSGGCNLNGALRKFNLALQPVFTQGSVTIYAVPGR